MTAKYVNAHLAVTGVPWGGGGDRWAGEWGRRQLYSRSRGGFFIFILHISSALWDSSVTAGRPIKSQREAGRLSAMSEGERPSSRAVEAGGRGAGLGWRSWRPMPFTESRVIAKVGGGGGGFLRQRGASGAEPHALRLEMQLLVSRGNGLPASRDTEGPAGGAVQNRRH